MYCHPVTDTLDLTILPHSTLTTTRHNRGIPAVLVQTAPSYPHQYTAIYQNLEYQTLEVHTVSHAVDFPNYTRSHHSQPSAVKPLPSAFSQCLSALPSDLMSLAYEHPFSVRSLPSHLYTLQIIPSTPDHTL